jgi:hypothetical protein
MYVNAEFLSDGSIAQSERDELFHEVRSLVHGMSDLIDSLLYLRRPGGGLYPEYESTTLLTQRSVRMVRSILERVMSTLAKKYGGYFETLARDLRTGHDVHNPFDLMGPAVRLYAD